MSFLRKLITGSDIKEKDDLSGGKNLIKVSGVDFDKAKVKEGTALAKQTHAGYGSDDSESFAFTTIPGEFVAAPPKKVVADKPAQSSIQNQSGKDASLARIYQNVQHKYESKDYVAVQQQEFFSAVMQGATLNELMVNGMRDFTTVTFLAYKTEDELFRQIMRNLLVMKTHNREQSDALFNVTKAWAQAIVKPEAPKKVSVATGAGFTARPKPAPASASKVEIPDFLTGASSSAAGDTDLFAGMTAASSPRKR